MTAYNLELFADYFQFYVQDDDRTIGDLSSAWTPEAVDHLLAVGPGVVGVGTVRNMNVPVTIEIHDREPPGDLDLWEHVTECGLEVRTGRLVVAGCTDYFPDAKRIQVGPGIYKVRVSCGGLDTLSEDGLEGDDRYRLQLWPAQSIGSPQVVKQRRSSS